MSMKKVIAINGSPRSGWNTATLVREAAAGAESMGVQAEVIDLYRLEPFTGCVSCFGCKTASPAGRCIHRDGLTAVLEGMRAADAIILGSPVYLGDISAGMRALYERLIFQYITYKSEPRSYADRRIPVGLILTSNVDAEHDAALLQRYAGMLTAFIGPTHTLACGDTLQVSDYSRYDWTMFDADAKHARHAEVFPQERRKAFEMGAELVK